MREFLIDMDANNAYRRLGRSCRHPAKRAHEMMQRPAVKAAIEGAMKVRAEAAEITVQRLVEEYTRIALGPTQGPTTMSHRLMALDSLAKYKGLFKPDAVTMTPVIFQFVGAPPLPADNCKDADDIRKVASFRQRG